MLISTGELAALQEDALDVIARIDDVPLGTLLSGPDGTVKLSDARRGDVAIIGTGGPYAIGLFSEETYGTAKMFDVIVQAKAAEFAVTPRPAKRDVIRLVYEKAEAAGSGQVETDSTDIELLIGSIIEDALRRSASDIHIESRENRADVLFRINGERVFISNLAFGTALGLGQVLYGVHADVSSKEVGWSVHEVAEGSIDWSTSRGERLQLRFSSSPIFPSGNFQIVIRLMSARAQPRSLRSLGYSQAQLDAIDGFTTGSGGMVIMCGPTNSGKSTSLQSLVERVFEVRGRQLKVITVEDPVELVISGACQISVGRRRAQREHETSPFSSFLRGTLRQDPDVVMMGEIRDHDSASLACDLALSGRKVFVTLHTYSALWAFSRLRELGVRPDLLAMPGFIAGICYQKLVPVLCKHCSEPDTSVATGTTALHAAVRNAAPVAGAVRRRGPGCSHCNNTGISGRTLVSEIAVPDRKLFSTLATGDMVEAEDQWLGGVGNPSAVDGLYTSHDHVLLKILGGTVSIKDAITQIGIADQYRYTGHCA